MVFVLVINIGLKDQQEAGLLRGSNGVEYVICFLNGRVLCVLVVVLNYLRGLDQVERMLK